MAYNVSSNSHGTWFQEQMNMINNSSVAELDSLSDTFAKNFQEAVTDIENSYNGINVMRDAKKMMDNPEIMAEYKTQLLDPILDEIRTAAADQNDPGEKFHLKHRAAYIR